MDTIRVDKPVRLADDLPNLGLRRGRVGTVCSHWGIAGSTYEVEFGRCGDSVRVLLTPRQIEPAPDEDGARRGSDHPEGALKPAMASVAVRRVGARWCGRAAGPGRVAAR
jgi:hypothetical protein